MTHRFLGLDSYEWETADGLPYSPMTGAPLTVEDVKAAIVAMLRRLDELDRPVEWVDCDGGDSCPLAVDIGAHQHTVNPDGTFGVLVRRPDDQ